MTHLANANLLDESVANSGSLKNKRLNKTAQTASNPNPPIMKKVEDEQEEDDDYEVKDRQDINYEKYQKDFMKNNTIDVEKSSDDNKILGMPKALAIGLGIAALAVGAYFTYKYIKKNKGKGAVSSDAGASVVSASATPDVKL